MNYKNIYDSIINRAKNRILVGYKEVHHIVPRCIGGEDESDNLVALTPEEHYVAHQLLVKIYPLESKLVFAAHRMCSNKNGRKNKLYGWLRRKHADATSKINSINQRGENNSRYNSRWVTNGIDNLSLNANQDAPAGWTYGRTMTKHRGKKRTPEQRLKISQGRKNYRYKYIINTSTREKRRLNSLLPLPLGWVYVEKPETTKKEKNIKIQPIKNDTFKKELVFKYYSDYKNSGLSLSKFAEKINVHKMNLSNWFTRYIDEYKQNSKPRINTNKK